MILSHHGHLEFGSPKVPQFPEAMLLHYLDDLDSKMECMRALVEHDRQLEGCFTSYSSALERTVLKMGRYRTWDMPLGLSVSPETNGMARQRHKRTQRQTERRGNRRPCQPRLPHLTCQQPRHPPSRAGRANRSAGSRSVHAARAPRAGPRAAGARSASALRLQTRFDFRR